MIRRANEFERWIVSEILKLKKQAKAKPFGVVSTGQILGAIEAMQTVLYAYKNYLQKKPLERNETKLPRGKIKVMKG